MLLRKFIFVCVLCCLFPLSALAQEESRSLAARVGNWKADIVQDGKVIGTRSLTVQSILNSRFQACRYLDEVGTTSTRGLQLISLDGNGKPVAARCYDSTGDCYTCDVSDQAGKLVWEQDGRKYEEAVGSEGPKTASIRNRDGKTFELNNFRRHDFTVGQQIGTEAPPIESPMGKFVDRIGTWQGDIFFLGRKVFDFSFSWGWDLDGRIQVQHRKAGDELVIDSWNANKKSYESTTFNRNGEISTRRLEVAANQRDVILGETDDLGVSRVVESFADKPEPFIRGLKPNGSIVWECRDLVRVSPIPLYVEAESGTDKVITFPDDVEFRESVQYNTNGPVELHLDFACPKDKSSRKPCVVVLHGGAWRAGDKSDVRNTLAQLSGEGFAAVAVQYRLCPEHRFPCQVHDVKCAVRYLRANADSLGIDTDRIAAIGYSAGGHLAPMLGLTSSDDGLEGDGGWAEHSSQVHAVASYSGPTSYTDEGVPEAELLEHPLLVDFIQAKNVDEMRHQLRLASPATYVDRNDAPVLMLHGTQDGLVPVEQVHVLAKLLTEASVPHEVCLGEYNHGGMSPQEQAEADRMLLSFLRETLRIDQPQDGGE